MNAQDRARELMTRDRQADDHRHDTLLERAEEGLERHSDGAIAEEARELLSEDRKHDAHLNDTMRERAEEGV